MVASILVPLDGSEFAEFALPVAASLARAGDGSLEIVMIQDPEPPLGLGERSEAPEEWREEYLANVRQALEEDTGVPATANLGVGAAGDELQAYVEERRPDLVVMATHGRGPLSRLWLGSVADHQMRHSPSPIVLVRPEEGSVADVTEEFRFDHILVPLDGSKRAERILEPALAVGRLFQARFTLVRVVHYPAEIVSSYMPDTVRVSEEVVETGRIEAEKYLTDVAGRLRAEGISVSIDVPVDVHPTAGILRSVEDSGANLVALATHGDSGVRRAVLGSVADKLIRGADLPVLVYRPVGLDEEEGYGYRSTDAE